MKLSIVIPAFNEEEAIGATVRRCLEARAHIIAQSPVDDVEITVVSDGSTDRTVEIAEAITGIRLIIFERNRGYGAAIKEGFRQSSGELVSFLDADGTCDPQFFATLCSALVRQRASVALGSRLGPQSRMPRVRRLGNRIYAFILSMLSNRMVSDTASGMRVIRRDVLQKLYPLPDGLHFTPAMSARVLMDDRLTIVECPMPYEERIGESKLSVWRDGVRFLHTILQMTLMWRPTKLFLTGAIVCLTLMTVLALHPLEAWLRNGSLEETTIYRLLFCSLLGMMGVSLLSAGVLTDQLHRMLDEAPPRATFVSAALNGIFTPRGLGVVLLVAVPLLVWLVGAGIWTRLADGYVALHWSRVVLAGLIAFAIGQITITVLVANIIRFHTRRKQNAAAPVMKTAAMTTGTIRKERVDAAPRSDALPVT